MLYLQIRLYKGSGKTYLLVRSKRKAWEAYIVRVTSYPDSWMLASALLRLAPFLCLQRRLRQQNNGNLMLEKKKNTSILERCWPCFPQVSMQTEHPDQTFQPNADFIFLALLVHLPSFCGPKEKNKTVMSSRCCNKHKGTDCCTANEVGIIFVLRCEV